MLNHFDIAYGLGLGLSSPWWLLRPSARAKVMGALSQRMGQVPQRQGDAPAVLIHAVSVGEINATRLLVQRLSAARPDLQMIVSVTTHTGFERGQELYGQDPRVLLVRYPLDFSGAINRFLDHLRPSVVVLLELEVWPNFLRQCQRRNIPVVLVNGRVTASSYRHYRLAGPLVKPMFRRLASICAQDETYARRFTRLGAAAQRVQVTGTMKFDTATLSPRVAGDADLAAALHLQPAAFSFTQHPVLGIQHAERVWVCGSTGPGEEPMILRCYRNLLERHPRLRLAIVPRKPERFDEVAGLIAQAGFDVLRRSRTIVSPLSAHRRASSVLPTIILGDTMGELRKFYSLADVVFVGRSLVDLGPRQNGSDMIEPAAMAKPIVVGPHTANFAEAMAQFKAAEAVLQVENESELAERISVLLSNPAQSSAMARRAQEVVRQNQGASNRHAALILGLLPPPAGTDQPSTFSTTGPAQVV